MRLSKILPLFFLFSCSKKEPVENEPRALDPVVHEVASTYRTLLPQVQDRHGAIHFDNCDSLTFSALLGADPQVHFDPRAFQDASGRFHRRPTDYRECFPDESRSTISMDPILGLLWYAYTHRDLSLAQSIWDYGHARSWVMGDGPRDLVYIGVLVPTLAQLLHVLGGPDHPIRNVPFEWPKGVTGYRSHLLMLQLILRANLYGRLETSGIDVARDQAQRQPRNALFQCANGNIEQAFTTLRDTALFPRDRLPSAKDRCEPWLFQRDEDDNWVPCDRDKTHSGGELLFVNYLIENGLCLD